MRVGPGRVPARRPISAAALAAHILSLYVAVGLSFLPGAVGSPWWWPYLLFGLLVATAGFALVLLAHRRTLPGKIVAAMSGQAVAIILLMGSIVHAVGLIDNGTLVAKPPLADALYFSIVTWTTLGYGDLQPIHAYRLLASAESLVGYVYLGLIVGLVTNLFRPEA